MPAELDPAWEYYVGDEEVTDILTEASQRWGRQVGFMGDEHTGTNEGYMRLGNDSLVRTAIKHTKQVVFAYLYACTAFNLIDIAVRLGVSKGTLKNWRVAMRLKCRNRRGKHA